MDPCTSPHPDELPAVAVLWTPTSYSAFLVADAARDLCRLVWVVDTSDPDLGRFQRLLARLGSVVSTDGCPAEVVAESLHRLGVAGVTTFTDAPIPLAADLAVRLGLPFHDPVTATRLTDKLEQRAAFAAAGVPSAACRLVTAGSPAPEDFPLPAVVKPRRGAASRDVVLATTPVELKQAVADADEDLLVEEFLPDRATQHPDAADMVSVESVVVDGVVTHLAVTGRFPLAVPFRETGDYLPNDSDPEEAAALQAVAAQAAQAVGVRNGFMHTEVKRTPSGPRVVEANGRLGQGIPQMVLRAGGVDLLRQALLLALDRPLDPWRELGGVAWFLMAQAAADATTVVAVDGLEEVAGTAGITDVRLNRPPGSALDAREGTLSHVYAVDGHAPDHASAFAMRREVYARVRVETR